MAMDPWKVRYGSSLGDQYDTCQMMLPLLQQSVVMTILSVNHLVVAVPLVVVG